jgi:hypothetical protein
VSEQDQALTIQRVGRECAYGRLPVMQGVQHEAEGHKIKLLVLPTIEAIELLKRKPKDTNAILHVTAKPLRFRRWLPYFWGN